MHPMPDDKTMKERRSSVISFLLFALLLPVAGCSPAPQLDEALEVREVISGWFDAGIVDGQKNKLVPSISFALHNRGDERVGTVQLNAVFRRLGEEEELGSAYVIHRNGLPPGHSTESFVMRSGIGYTGEQPRAQMLEHSEFIDARVEIFAKSGAAPWVKLDEYVIERQLLTR
jgi:hypothetical protein